MVSASTRSGYASARSSAACSALAASRRASRLRRDLLQTFPSQPCYTGTPLAAFPSAQVTPPSAAVLARLAAEGRSIVATGDLEPIYLREPHITIPNARLV